MKAKAGATAVPYPGHLDAHRTNAGMYLALRQGAIPDHRLTALGIMAVRILGSQHPNFRLNGLRQESLCALTSHLRSGIRSRARWMRKGNRSMCLHGVSTPAS